MTEKRTRENPAVVAAEALPSEFSHGPGLVAPEYPDGRPSTPADEVDRYLTRGVPPAAYTGMSPAMNAPGFGLIDELAERRSRR